MRESAQKYSFEKITLGTVVYVTCVVLDNAAQLRVDEVVSPVYQIFKILSSR